MFTRLFVGLLGLIFTTYGTACFVAPNLLFTIAGIEATSATAMAEIQAMYGGVQIGIGIFYCVGAMNRAYTKSVLLCHCLLFTAVVFARALGIYLQGNSWSPMAGESYNAAALWLFEIPVLVIGFINLRPIHKPI